MNTVQRNDKIPVCGSYDVIVAGGGVAGVAAAVSAARLGKKVLLLEKTVALGGLATNGIINLFVPMCNGRGKQIIKGMAEEFLRLSIKYGYDTIPDKWLNGEPGVACGQRYCTRFSPGIFSLALTELVINEGIDILYDTVVSQPVMTGGHCEGLIVENKSGSQFYGAKMIVDVTGDADVLYRAGVPTVQGKNYFTMVALLSDVGTVKKAYDSNDMRYATKYVSGGGANLYGGGHPEDMPTFKGTDVKDVSDFIIKNHLKMLENIKKTDRKMRDVVMLPAMAQFRTTRMLAGDSVFDINNAYKHCDTSIGAICDFDRADYLYEIPYGSLVKTGYDNLITAGRTASSQNDYSWDVLRVIPPAIITGQAAGVACALAIDNNTEIFNVDVPKIQRILSEQDVMIHFDDSLIPDGTEEEVKLADIGHI